MNITATKSVSKPNRKVFCVLVLAVMLVCTFCPIDKAFSDPSRQKAVDARRKAVQEGTASPLTGRGTPTNNNVPATVTTTGSELTIPTEELEAMRDFSQVMYRANAVDARSLNDLVGGGGILRTVSGDVDFPAQTRNLEVVGFGKISEGEGPMMLKRLIFKDTQTGNYTVYDFSYGGDHPIASVVKNIQPNGSISPNDVLRIGEDNSIVYGKYNYELGFEEKQTVLDKITVKKKVPVLETTQDETEQKRLAQEAAEQQAREAEEASKRAQEAAEQQAREAEEASKRAQEAAEQRAREAQEAAEKAKQEAEQKIQEAKKRAEEAKKRAEEAIEKAKQEAEKAKRAAAAKRGNPTEQVKNAREAAKNPSQLNSMTGEQLAEKYGLGVADAMKVDGLNAAAALAAQNAASDTAYRGMVAAAYKGASGKITSEMISSAKARLVAQGNATPTVEDITKEILSDSGSKSQLLEGAGAEIDAQLGGIKTDSVRAAQEAAKKLDPTHPLSKENAEKMADVAVEGQRKEATEEGVQKAVEDEVKKAEDAPKGFEVNAAEYALLVLEAIEQKKINEVTKHVKVKAAEMQDSQGTEEKTATETAIAATAKTLMDMLKEATIDMSLISTDIAKQKTPTINAGVMASAAKSGAGVLATNKTVVTQTSATIATEEERELRRRRALLVGEWATAATQIGEASNAMSKNFYDRVAMFAEAANDAEGSLGGITAISDTDRFVLFEITRGAALSSMSLGLQGSVNLNDMSDIVLTSTTKQ